VTIFHVPYVWHATLLEALWLLSWIVSTVLTVMNLRRKRDRETVEARLENTERDIVDMAARLVRLEAEVGIYKPLFDSDKGST
jgi:hypothetical protein